MIRKILIIAIAFLPLLCSAKKKCTIGIVAVIDDNGRVTHFHEDGSVSYSWEIRDRGSNKSIIKEDYPLSLDLHIRQLEIDRISKNYRYRVNDEKFKSYSHARKRIQYYEKEAAKVGATLYIEKLKHNRGFSICGHEDLPLPEPYIKTRYDKIIEKKQKAQKEKEDPAKNDVTKVDPFKKPPAPKQKLEKQENIRTFTIKDGAQIKGRLVGVAYLKKAVVLQGSKNERLYVPLSSFSQSDLNFIKNWWAENS